MGDGSGAPVVVVNLRVDPHLNVDGRELARAVAQQLPKVVWHATGQRRSLPPPTGSSVVREADEEAEGVLKCALPEPPQPHCAVAASRGDPAPLR